MEVLLDALAYIMEDFEADDKDEVEGQGWVSLAEQKDKEPQYFFAMHAYFIRRLAQLVDQYVTIGGNGFHEVTNSPA